MSEPSPRRFANAYYEDDRFVIRRDETRWIACDDPVELDTVEKVEIKR